MNEEVVITGIGTMGSFGVGWDALKQAIINPKSFIGPLPGSLQDDVDFPLPSCYAATLGEAADKLIAETASRLDRAAGIGLAVAAEAMLAAGLSPGSVDPRRAGVYWGTAMGGIHTAEFGYHQLFKKRQPLRPTLITRIMSNAAAAHIAMKFNMRGPNQTFSIACASSSTALGEALHAIRAGRVDVVLAGGSEAMIKPGVLTGWNGLRVMSSGNVVAPEMSCRPFSLERTGLVMGEGGAAFVLESGDHARRRGILPIANLVGYGASCDAYSLVVPQVDGQIEAMRIALADAGIRNDQIELVIAHATGTKDGDITEAKSLTSLFGRHSVPVSSVKPIFGHTLGAAGAMGLAAGIAASTINIIPATLTLDPVDPACATLDLCALNRDASGSSLRGGHILVNAFAFGGANATLVAKLIA